jgi:uncharacterized protein YraI
MSTRTSFSQSISVLVVVVLCLAGLLVLASLAPVPAAAQATFPAQAVVIQNANIRAGPGTTYAIVGKATTGQVLNLTAANANNSWYQLDDGNWIAAFLVVRVAPGAVLATVPATPTDVLVPLPGTPAATVLTDTTGAAPLPGMPVPLVAATPPLSIPLPVDAQPVQVLQVVDGATVLVQIGAQTETVRYIGVAAPAQGQPGFGLSADANRSLVTGQTVYLVREQSDRNAENELLRHLLRADGTIVGAQLIADGWAQPLSIAPDTARIADYTSLAVAAAAGRRGFWGATPDANPAAYALTLAPATLFDGPSGANAADAVLPAMTPLTLIGRTNDGAWVQVRDLRRDQGWVFVPLLNANVPISTLPVTFEGASGPTPMPPAGQAQATPIPATPFTDPNLAGVPTPIQDPNLAGFQTPIPTVDPFGFPTPIQDPGLPIPGTPFPGVPVPGVSGPVVSQQANLREGPGTQYPVLGTAAPGSLVALAGQNVEGTWYQTSTNGWIAAALVANVPPGLPIVAPPPLPSPTATPLPTVVVVVPPGAAPPATPTPTPTITPVLQAPPTTPTPAPKAVVRIIAVNRGAEWVLLYNDGDAAQALDGWTLRSEKDEQICTLSGTLAPRGALRVWAGNGPDGLSCGLTGDVWDNTEPDAAVLIDAQGNEVSRFQ